MTSRQNSSADLSSDHEVTINPRNTPGQRPTEETANLDLFGDARLEPAQTPLPDSTDISPPNSASIVTRTREAMASSTPRPPTANPSFVRLRASAAPTNVVLTKEEYDELMRFRAASALTVRADATAPVKRKTSSQEVVAAAPNFKVPTSSGFNLSREIQRSRRVFGTYRDKYGPVEFDALIFNTSFDGDQQESILNLLGHPDVLDFENVDKFVSVATEACQLQDNDFAVMRGFTPPLNRHPSENILDWDKRFHTNLNRLITPGLLTDQMKVVLYISNIGTGDAASRELRRAFHANPNIPLASVMDLARSHNVPQVQLDEPSRRHGPRVNFSYGIDEAKARPRSKSRFQPLPPCNINVKKDMRPPCVVRGGKLCAQCKLWCANHTICTFCRKQGHVIASCTDPARTLFRRK